MPWIALACLLLFLPQPARAVDGVREIHQSCVAVGCFPSDRPGFPVEIGALSSGSYRLTSNLVLGTGDPGAIQVDAPFVTIDLNGFNILGLNDCSGTAGAVRCDVQNATIGIVSRATGTTVRNGGVHGVGSHGIALIDHANVESVRVTDASGDGIQVGSDSTVRNSRVWEVGGDGITGAASAVRVLAAGNHVSQAGDEPIDGAVTQADGNLCDGAVCTTVPPVPEPEIPGPRRIDQACAIAGCFPGDAPGFPVEISALSSGSYQLTSNLILGLADPIAITVNAPFTTIDLGGYNVRGLNDCTAVGGNVSCNQIGFGVAIISQAEGTTVRNGGVHGIVGNGIDLAEFGRVEDVRVSDVSTNAITVDSDSVVAGVQIWEVGGDGITRRAGAERVVTRDNQVSFVGNQTFTAGITEGGGNRCDDGRCRPVLRKRYYLTADTVAGADLALTACDEGFHMASLYELTYPSNLEYDLSRGFQVPDSGSGPPATAAGWIRTGFQPWNLPDQPGRSNCVNWSSDASTDYGSRASFNPRWFEDPSFPIFDRNHTSCNANSQVWCIED